MAETEDRTDDTASDVSSDAGYDPNALKLIIGALADRDHLAVREVFAEQHPADAADLIEALPVEARDALVRALGETLDPAILPELVEDARAGVVALLEPDQIAEAIDCLESDDAAFVLADLDDTVRDQVLVQTAATKREAVRTALSYENDQAGRIMQRAFVAAPSYWSVGQIIDHMRGAEDLPDQFYEIFVVDPGFHPIGSIPLSRVLKTTRDVPIGEIMDVDLHAVRDETDQEEVAYLFEKYNMVSAAVTDANGRLVGVITVDDVVEVVQEESHEDMLALGGVTGAEGLSETVGSIVRGRVGWLAINLGTAILASAVIKVFDEAIERYVALAVLMPIIASMGGNAATQTMTVAVRALATRELSAANSVRVVGREALVGLVNGVIFAVALGIAAGLTFADPALGAVVAIAMVVNLLAAGLSGIAIPMVLQRMNFDPAVSSSVFVTTVTDVVGFFVFLGLAATLLL